MQLPRTASSLQCGEARRRERLLLFLTPAPVLWILRFSVLFGFETVCRRFIACLFRSMLVLVDRVTPVSWRPCCVIVGHDSFR